MSTLAQDGDDSEVFDLGLRALREEEGTIEQARALEERLLDALGPEALAAPITATSRSHALLLTKPVKALIGVTMLIGLGMYLAHEGQSRLPETSQRAVRPAARAVALAPPPPGIEHPQTVAARAPTEIEAVQAAQPRRKPAAAHPRVDELTLLQRARAALQDDPQAALRIAEQHAREFPRGVFVQEREVLAINALMKQRRAADAFERAERFVAAHEGSSYSVQLRAMLASKPAATRPERAEP